MRVIYADTGLSQDLGHHANACRLMTAEWRIQGYDVSVAASHLVTPTLQQELGAAPHFRVHTYWYNDGDPYSGWLNAFFHSAQLTAEDFALLGPFTPADLLYVNSIQPAQLMAIASFLRDTPVPHRPRVVAELGTAPGLDFEWRGDTLHFHAKDPRYDAKAAFYRFASRALAGSADPVLLTFHEACSSVYSHLLRRPVSTVPVPHQALLAPVSRQEGKPRVIGVLGHQRADKGYHLMPAIAQLLLRGNPDLRLLLHNGAPGYMHEVQAEVRAMAAREPRMIVDERVADQKIWHDLLQGCDIVLCPYDPPSYIGAYSAIVGEALSMGIPVVVPECTTLARTFMEHGSPGATFYHYRPDEIAASVLTVLADFSTHEARAMAAALNWTARMGAANTVASIVSLLAEQPERKAA